jgi:hypothetical protein
MPNPGAKIRPGQVEACWQDGISRGIEQVTVSALTDTDARVLTISSDFYNQYLSRIEIHPLDVVLCV